MLDPLLAAPLVDCDLDSDSDPDLDSGPDADPTQVTPIAELVGTDPMILHQTIVKFRQLVPIPRSTPLQVSPLLVEAMLHLVEMVDYLRSPQGGWPADLEATPATLAPYVIEEAYEVIHALKHTDALTEPLQVPPTTPAHFLTQLQSHCSIEQLIPQLLWGIARGSYEIMQLLGGVRAERCKPGENWQNGILRLVPILELQTAATVWSLDLVTHRPWQDGLAQAVVLRSPEGSLCPAPVWSGNLLQSLVQQIQVSTPEIPPLMTGADVDVLIPGQSWQAGRAQLRLEFAFIADASWPALPSTKLRDAAADWIEGAIVRLIDPVIQQHFLEYLIQHQMTGPIPQWQHRLQTGPSEIDAEEALVPDLVAVACEIVARSASPAQIAEFHLLQPGILSDEWLPRLLWQLTQVSPQVTQLISGIRAQILRPGQGWETGILRLLALVQLTIGDEVWVFDLTTGQLLPPDLHLLEPSVIIQTHESVLCQGPERGERFIATLQAQLPESHLMLQSLLQSSPIELLQTDGTWQAGIIQLQLGLFFQPLTD